MRFRRVGLVHTMLVATAVGLAACTAQSTAPAPIRQVDSNPASSASIGHGATQMVDTTRIRLVPGMSIGVNTFPDGDTATGGQGQKIAPHLACHQDMPPAFHVHVHLSIFDPTGTQIMVPWAVGIVAPWTFNHAGNQVLGGTCFYFLHTHDRSGVIHYEATRDLGFTLGDFFDVWGEPLTTTNVAGYAGTVWVKIITPTSNGPWTTSIDPRTIPLTEHAQISLAVGNPVSPVPKYTFTY
jgi:hypothetical protein